MKRSSADTLSIESEVAQLRGLDLVGLRARWRSVTGRSAPPQVPKHLLFRMLAYRLQADTFGDLDKATIRYLDTLARGGGSAQVTSEPLALLGGGAVPPGTLLMREWNGAQHR